MAFRALVDAPGLHHSSRVPALKIFCDARLDAEALERLRAGLAPHELLLAREPGHVLNVNAPDATIAAADVALGQPAVESVLGAPRLRWVHVTSASVTRYDTPAFRSAAAQRGLLLTNSSTVYAEACAEHAFAFLLAQARQLPRALRSRAAGGSPEWTALRGAMARLRGGRVVILGYGAIARRLVELLAPFAMAITAMRRHPRGDEGAPAVAPDDLAPALAVADHVINILPHNAESEHFVSRERLAQMKRGAVFYNIGRGATVDQDALAASLHAGHLAAAWLDVTEPEPLPEGHVLWAAPNCYITPHVAGGYPGELLVLVDHFLDNLRRYENGSPLKDRVM